MKHHQPTQYSRAARRIPSVLLVACALHGGLLHGSEMNSGAANFPGNGVAPNRAGDRLAPAEFAEPPVHVRPGAFWDWLNGSITKEQITRDLEAMQRGGNPHFPALRSGHQLLQRPSPGKQFPSIKGFGPLKVLMLRFRRPVI
jgi:hypothetical protein